MKNWLLLTCDGFCSIFFQNELYKAKPFPGRKIIEMQIYVWSSVYTKQLSIIKFNLLWEILCDKHHRSICSCMVDLISIISENIKYMIWCILFVSFRRPVKMVWQIVDIYYVPVSQPAPVDVQYNLCCQFTGSQLSQGGNLSSAGPIYIQKPDFVITLPADGLAPNGARPSAGTVLTINLDTPSSNSSSFWWFLSTLITRLCHLNWQMRFCKISKHFDFKPRATLQQFHMYPVEGHGKQG